MSLKMRGVLLMARVTGGKPMNELPVAEARQATVLRLRKSRSTAPVAGMVNRAIPGPAGDIPIRIYTPEGAGQFPLLVYFHGGGFVVGSIDGSHELCRTVRWGADLDHLVFLPSGDPALTRRTRAFGLVGCGSEVETCPQTARAPRLAGGRGRPGPGRAGTSGRCRGHDRIEARSAGAAARVLEKWERGKPPAKRQGWLHTDHTAGHSCPASFF